MLGVASVRCVGVIYVLCWCDISKCVGVMLCYVGVISVLCWCDINSRCIGVISVGVLV